MQGWQPEKQREFLHTLPASIATEATVQLLVQSAHKWVFVLPTKPTAAESGGGGDGLDGVAEQKQDVGEQPCL